MKISVTVKLDIDAEAWMREYGIDRADVRADVKDYVQSAIQQHIDGLGLLASRS